MFYEKTLYEGRNNSLKNQNLKSTYNYHF